MTAELYGHAPPNSEALVIAWLLPLAGSEAKISSKRWGSTMALPYWMVRRIDGGDDLITDYPTIRVHTFAKTYTEASREATNAHLRMLLLADDPLLDITMPGGAVANCAWLETDEWPHEEPYAAESVVTRFVAQYRLGLNFTPVT